MALIMVVDDDPGIVSVLTDMLSSRGHQVITALDGVEMIEKAKDLVPQLMIVDLMMPGSYGSAAYKTLQQDPKTASIPVVFLTAVPPDRAKKVVPESPNVRLLFKPLNITPLFQAITELLPSSTNH